MEFFKNLVCKYFFFNLQIQAFIAPADEVAAENGELEISSATELANGLFPKANVKSLIKRLVDGKWLFMVGKELNKL